MPFPRGIKVKIIARLEFELAYYDIAAQHVSHYAMATFRITSYLKQYNCLQKTKTKQKQNKTKQKNKTQEKLNSALNYLTRVNMPQNLPSNPYPDYLLF